MKEASLLQGSYKLAKVKRVVVGLDNHVRRAVLEYKNTEAGSDLTKAKFKETERSIHSLVVIVPVNWKEEEIQESVKNGIQLIQV